VLTISGRNLGSKRPLFADWSVPPPPDLGDGGPVTLRELIARIVRAEVQAFRSRQEARRLDRVMSPAQIDAGAAKGRVNPAGRTLRQRVDEDDAIATAHQAFEDGLYLVILDGAEERELDKEVYLKPDSRVTFIRLVFLAGA
jgi:hypothetical protein